MTPWKLVSSTALFVLSQPLIGRTSGFNLSQQQRHQDIASRLNLAPVTPNFVPKSKYETLVEWLRSQSGGEVNAKLYIDESKLGGGMGYFCSSDIEKDEILFTIPRTACVTLDDATGDDACGENFKKFMEKAGPGSDTVVMAAFLAKEYLLSMDDKKLDVRFGPYLDTLPFERGINNQEHVIFWSDEDVESTLKGSFCYEESTKLRSEVALACTYISALVSDAIRKERGEEDEGFTLPWQTKKPKEPIEQLDEAVRGAFVCLLTRSFEDGGTDEKLVPVLDMINHSDTPNIRHGKRKVDGTVEVKARHALKTGDELVNQYRSEEDENMPYHRFFARYGFVPGIMEPIENLLTDQSSIFFPKVVEL